MLCAAVALIHQLYLVEQRVTRAGITIVVGIDNHEVCFACFEMGRRCNGRARAVLTCGGVGIVCENGDAALIVKDALVFDLGDILPNGRVNDRLVANVDLLPWGQTVNRYLHQTECRVVVRNNVASVALDRSWNEGCVGIHEIFVCEHRCCCTARVADGHLIEKHVTGAGFAIGVGIHNQLITHECTEDGSVRQNGHRWIVVNICIRII